MRSASSLMASPTGLGSRASTWVGPGGKRSRTCNPMAGPTDRRRPIHSSRHNARTRWRTAWICDERFFWHDPGSGVLDLRPGGWLEPAQSADWPTTERRAQNLLGLSSLSDQLVRPKPRMATVAEVLRFHDAKYVQKV